MNKGYSLILSILFALLTLNVGFGQEETVDKIQMKDGTVYLGKIISHSEDGLITFVVEGTEEILTLDQKDVLSMTFKSRTPESNFVDSTPFSLQDKKVSAEMSYSTRNGSGFGGNSVRLGLYYNLGRQFQFGAGISKDKYRHEFPATIVNFSGDFRIFAKAEKLAPYLGFEIGYGKALRPANFFGTVYEKEGGLNYQPYIGLLIGMTKSAALNLLAGYKFQKARYVAEDFRRDVVTYDYKFKRFVFGVGFISYF